MQGAVREIDVDRAAFGNRDPRRRTPRHVLSAARRMAASRVAVDQPVTLRPKFLAVIALAAAVELALLWGLVRDQRSRQDHVLLGLLSSWLA